MISTLGVVEEERGCIQTLSSRIFLYSSRDKQQTRLCSLLVYHTVEIRYLIVILVKGMPVIFDRVTYLDVGCYIVFKEFRSHCE